MARTLSVIDVCKMVEARGGCDLSQAPYRVPDTLSPEMRVRILTAMARAGADNDTVCGAAYQALKKYLPSGFDPREIDEEAKANALLAFVQKDVGYKSDKEGEEQYQGPIYTLRNGGDCEDLSVLFVAMCSCVGVQSRIVWMDQPKAQLNHVTAEVLIRGSWEFAETTIASAKVGEHPYDAAKRHKTAYRKEAERRLGF